MRIIYTVDNSFLLETEDGLVYPFNMNNIDVLVAELSLDVDVCNEIKNKVLDLMKEKIDKKQLTETLPIEKIAQYIQNLILLNEYMPVLEILDRSTRTHKMITTDKPYETWQWDYQKEEYVAPMPYPTKLVESEPDKYIWNDDSLSWEPAEPAPHRGWLWDYAKEKYTSPVPYPLDAEPDEFKWDEEKMLWVVND